jgi:hypothetical protein
MPQDQRQHALTNAAETKHDQTARKTNMFHR